MTVKKLKINMVSESTFTVQGHGVHTAFEEMTNALKARQDTDVVVNKFRLGADVTHIQTIGLYSLLHLLFGPGKKVVSVHVVPDSLVGSIKGAEKFYNLATKYMRFFYGRADQLLAVSKMVEKTLRHDLGITKPIAVLYNTVNMVVYRASVQDKQMARQELGVKPGAFMVVGNGQIQPRKRFDVFCQAASALPDHKFVWVGGIPFKHLGADFAEMQKMSQNVPPNVQVTGVIEHAQVKRYLQAADAFFLPSDQENHPMAVLEAAGSGLPIVVRDLPEYNDTFDGDVLKGTDDTFVQLLSRLASDKAFYDQARQGSDRIAKRFDSHTGGERLMQCYTS